MTPKSPVGVELDRRLTFRQHIQNTASKSTRRTCSLYPILNNKNGLSMKSRLHVYNMMIRPKLTYAAPAWKHSAKSTQIQLQRVQNRAARMITGHPRDTSIVQLHEDLDIPLLKDVIASHCRSFWHRMSQSPHAILQNLGTVQPPRLTHKMPHPT